MEEKEPKIIFEDKYILVLEKRAGLVVNRVETVKNAKTLQDWVEEKYGKRMGEEEYVSRSGIVHRLDKETSGIILAAKDQESFKNLQGQFKLGEVEKTYIALCHGKVVPGEGEINVPVGRLPWDRQKFGVIASGRQSKTLYKVLEYKLLKTGKKEEILSLVEAYPKTGRTHQIRVHFRYIGFPIFADSLYAGRKNIQSDRKLLKRHFLHAAKIKFKHPKTNEVLYFESPLPKELVDFLSSISQSP